MSALINFIIIAFGVWLIRGSFGVIEQGIDVTIELEGKQILHSSGRALLGTLLISLASVQLCGDWVRSMFFCNKQAVPEPMWGIPAKRRSEGHFDSAFEAYMEIAKEFTQNPRVYRCMIDVAINDMFNEELARSSLALGLKKLKVKGDRESLKLHFHNYEKHFKNHKQVATPAKEVLQETSSPQYSADQPIPRPAKRPPRP